MEDLVKQDFAAAYNLFARRYNPNREFTLDEIAPFLLLIERHNLPKDFYNESWIRSWLKGCTTGAAPQEPSFSSETSSYHGHGGLDGPGVPADNTSGHRDGGSSCSHCNKSPHKKLCKGDKDGKEYCSFRCYLKSNDVDLMKLFF